MTPSQRLFAVIPAAGHSRRMGQAKLLLKVGEKTVIARLLAVLDHPAITERVVVVRRDDVALESEVRAAGATLVQPAVDPPDMRTSVEQALAYIDQHHHPAPDDGWLLVPADHPMLDASVMTLLIERWLSGRDRILVPTLENKHGHPTIFRWKLAAEVSQLAANEGLNALLHRHASDVAELAVDSPAVLMDLDVPDDYAAIRRLVGEEREGER
ncbi:MAG: NTP transferase domain-containing protein, partial [Planctomycetaceae bacterium]